MGRFLLGFVIGAAAGAAIVVITTPKSDDEQQVWLPGSLDEARTRLIEVRQGVVHTVQVALETGRSAISAHEQQLWGDFRKRLPRPPEPDAS